MPISPSELAQRFDHTVLHGQFALSETASALPSSWEQRTISTWTLAFHSVLPVATVKTTAGSDVGWLLGYAVGDTAAFVAGDLILPDSGDSIASRFETFLYTHGGRFAGILVTPDAQRVYLDPSGSLSAVYSESDRMVAATPALIPYTDQTRDHTELIGLMDLETTNAYYAFGLTPRHGIRRIVTNHYLDLKTWTQTRHWHIQDWGNMTNTDAAIEEIADIVGRHVRAVAAQTEYYLSLTAGYDSRMLLACARDSIDRASCFTFALGDRTARIDIDIAERIAKRLGLRYQVLPLDPPSREDEELWFYRSGCCIGEKRGREALGGYAKLNSAFAELPAVMGEVGRSFLYWQDLTGPVPTEEVIAKTKAPDHPLLRHAAQEWMDGVPTQDPLQLEMYWYIELRLGAWAGLLPYADPDHTAFRMYPFCHRRIFELTNAFTFVYRQNQSFANDIIRARWPELLKFPYNQYMGLKRTKMWARRRVYLARRGVKQLLGR